MVREEYRKLRLARKKYVDLQIRKLKDKLKTSKKSDAFHKIVRQRLTKIMEQIKAGELQSEDVLNAFQLQALEVHRQTNCLVEPILTTEVTQKTSHVEPDSPRLLNGIPVSIKDDIGIKGFVSSTGASKFLSSKCQEDSTLVKVLRRQGAVIFARTNEPQLGLSAEAGNPVYGPVKNPHDLTRNPGGSSSGEGALVGGGGSLLGFGSDIGGSIRIPAHNCGCCGFKPTSERISHRGNKVLGMGESAVPVTWGPLARDVDSLVLAMRALWDGCMTEFDPLCPPLKFQNNLFEDSNKLKIGYFKDNGYFAPTPVCERAVDMAVDELRRQGHEVTEWCPPNAADVDLVESQVLMADGGAEIINIMAGDEIDPTMKTIMMALKTPQIFKPMLPMLARWTMGPKDGEVAKTFNGCKNVAEYWNLQKQIKEYQYKVIEEWQRQGFDAVISPPMPYPALKSGNPDLSTRGTGYMMLYNVLNFPAGVVRMTKQTEEDIKKLKKYNIRDRFHEDVRQMLQDGIGLPAGVMVASLRWQDEKCLRVMKAVEKAADYEVEVMDSAQIKEEVSIVIEDHGVMECTNEKTRPNSKIHVQVEQEESTECHFFNGC